MKKIIILWALLAVAALSFAGFTFAEEAAPASESTVEQAAPQEADLPLLINNDNPLPDDYKPEKLVRLYDHKRSFKLQDSDIRVEAVVFEAMNAMFKAARADGLTNFLVTSGFRNRKSQTSIYKNDKQGVAAKPGHSEHETGLAFDVAAHGHEQFQKTPHYQWLKEHCWEYGFIIRYPKGKEDVTGIPYEPWHYRYVGVEHAMALKALGGYVTLEEYVAAGGAAGFPNDEAQTQESNIAETDSELADSIEDEWAMTIIE